MVGIIPYAGLDIAAFELMRERLHQQYGNQPPPQHLLLAGMLSSTGAQLVAYPFGLIRTRLQVRIHQIDITAFFIAQMQVPEQICMS